LQVSPASPSAVRVSYADSAGSLVNNATTNNILVYPLSAAWAEGISFTMPTTSTWGGLRWRRERAGYDGNWAVGYTGLDATDDLVFVSNNGGTQVNNVLRLTKAGAVSTSGSFTASGDICAYSDARVKTNIKTIENALSKVISLRGVSYNRTDSNDKKTKIGVIAQETLPIVPEVVNQDTDGMYNVAYGNLGGLFIEAFKEQQTEIKQLKELVNQLLSK
jgi:hypothetical protein